MAIAKVLHRFQTSMHGSVYGALCHDMGHYLAEQNERFDLHKFYEACGLLNFTKGGKPCE